MNLSSSSFWVLLKVFKFLFISTLFCGYYLRGLVGATIAPHHKLESYRQWFRCSTDALYWRFTQLLTRNLLLKKAFIFGSSRFLIGVGTYQQSSENLCLNLQALLSVLFSSLAAFRELDSLEECNYGRGITPTRISVPSNWWGIGGLLPEKKSGGAWNWAGSYSRSRFVQIRSMGVARYTSNQSFLSFVTHFYIISILLSSSSMLIIWALMGEYLKVNVRTIIITICIGLN